MQLLDPRLCGGLMNRSVVIALLLSLGLSACDRAETRLIKVSPETAALLADLDSSLGAADSPIRFQCPTSASCAFQIAADHRASLLVETINHPFLGTPLYARIQVESQPLSLAL